MLVKNKEMVKGDKDLPEDPGAGYAGKPVYGGEQEAGQAARARADHAHCHQRAKPVDGQGDHKAQEAPICLLHRWLLICGYLRRRRGFSNCAVVYAFEAHVLFASCCYWGTW